jgi:hypothetical protein
MNDADIPWKTIGVMICLVLITGLAALSVSVRTIRRDTLINRIRRE